MQLEPTSEAIVGTATIIGAAVMVLKKLGFVKIGKAEETKPCPLHGKMNELVDTLKVVQTGNVQRLENHDDELQEGKNNFKKIDEEITLLRIGVGVLLDRSGGRPDDFRRNK